MYSLFLYASAGKGSSYSTTELVVQLTEQGIVGQSDYPDSYAAGERLMEFVNFLGCSPVVADGQTEGFVRIHNFGHRAALGGKSVVSIRYPVCGHVIPDPAAILATYPENRQWACPECGNSGDLETINWRKSAGFSRLFIEISGIFPKEALPTDNLLSLLQSVTGDDWHWFYSESSRTKSS